MHKTVQLFLQLLFIVSVSCIEAPGIESNPVNPSPIKYLALGDSYTIGESVPKSERWPLQLADSLTERGFIVDTTQIIAKTGWTTDELQTGIANRQPDSTFTLVSLLIGVNNQYRGLSQQIYEVEFEELLLQAITLAGSDTSRVFVVSIPNYGVTPFGMTRGEDRIRQELLEYDAIAKNISNKYGIPFVNITPISEDAKTDGTLVAPDNLHPSGRMYTLWVEEMLPVVTDLIKQ